MKTRVMAIQKGGQGKTFVTCHLALDFHERGYRVVVADMNVQANASYTLTGHQFGYTTSRLFNSDLAELRTHFSSHNNNGLMLIEADAALAATIEVRALAQYVFDKMEIAQ